VNENWSNRIYKTKHIYNIILSFNDIQNYRYNINYILRIKPANYQQKFNVKNSL